MLTKIPFFREIIISRFECRHCGYSNVGIDPATQIQEFGRKITLRVSSKEVFILHSVAFTFFPLFSVFRISIVKSSSQTRVLSKFRISSSKSRPGHKKEH